MINVYNSLNNKKEEFKPLNDGKITMYACGITVSKPAHIGHAYQAVVFDMIVKYFEYRGYDVKYVRNYTDVDDKIIACANEKGISPLKYAEELIEETDKEMKALGVKDPYIFAKVTEHIDDIIVFISKLIEKGYAYVTENGDVFFEVSKFKSYGKLSNNVVENNLVAVRKKLEDNKKNNEDFALWKSAKEGEIFWDSPWGKGRPGWHIECSTMSIKYLGETLDIHGGGRDLKFPHHENEIAQSEALTGKTFANYWIHNGLVKINGEKMSKSLNNSILLKDLLEEYDKEVIRMLLLNNSYQSDLNIMDGMFNNVEKHLYGFYQTLLKLNNIEDKTKSKELISKLDNDFVKAMDDNFNTPIVISYLFDIFNEINKNINEYDYETIMNGLSKIYYSIGIFQTEPQEFVNNLRKKYMKDITVEYIEEKINQRKTAKENKNFEEADNIRKELEEKNIQLKDTREGTIWDIIIK